MSYIDPIPPTNPRKNKVRPRPLPDQCSVDQPDVLPENSGKIELTRGLFAIVDLDMVDDLNRFSWSVAPDGRTCYALTRDVNKNNVRMHRHVLRINNSDDVTIDHINHNGLDNRRCNLRVVTRSENQLNRKAKTKDKKKNRFKGVLPGLTRGYTTWLKVDGKTTKKNFLNEVEAAKYYDYMVVKTRGPNATTNLSLGRYTPQELGEVYAQNMPEETIPEVNEEIKGMTVGKLRQQLKGQPRDKLILVESKYSAAVIPVEHGYINSDGDLVLFAEETEAAE